MPVVSISPPNPVVFHFSADVFQACPLYKLRLVIDPATLQMVLGVLTGWLDRRERQAVAYLIEENRLLRRQLGGRICALRFFCRYVLRRRDVREDLP